MIFSFEELEGQLKDTNDCLHNGDTFDTNKLLENYASVLKSHMKLQDRNEKLRLANSSLIEKIKGIKAVLRLK